LDGRAEEGMNELYFEDLAVGQRSGSGRIKVDADAIKSFAAQFDPQPFHLDEATASATRFKGLAASGWHTAALTMRLLVEGEFKPAGGILGAGVEQLSWPRPVRPGDELRVESEVIELRPSKSQQDLGLAKVRVTTFNQNGEPVQIFTATLIVPKRPA
jgi:acyl dehydratase